MLYSLWQGKNSQCDGFTAVMVKCSHFLQRRCLTETLLKPNTDFPQNKNRGFNSPSSPCPKLKVNILSIIVKIRPSVLRHQLFEAHAKCGSEVQAWTCTSLSSSQRWTPTPSWHTGKTQPVFGGLTRNTVSLARLPHYSPLPLTHWQTFLKN